ncbi:ABC transporter substrate-binding protein [Cohnella candidum]|uniref:Sugar ABC transporter substrate-binding protein n=1 Tax=Cohnella candidum TaxID=2674991 RepID=A0A3G3K376_9BACL|nr:sugar ABC transporter substrate-binding protein [Cohnella candidum]AYQ74964.1 sugar ABC transporter substrate-binding protein [Cohnella candidum]
MKKKWKYSAPLLLALCLALVLTACGGKNNNAGTDNAQPSASASAATGQKATITMGFWGTAQDLKTYQTAADNISKTYPNITLKIKQYPSSDQFWNQLPGEIAAGVAPDFIKLSNEGSYEYIQKGMFAQLDDLATQGKLDMSRFTQTSLDVWKVDGKQYGIPNSVMPGMFFINEDMWKKAGLGAYPTTWDEVKAAAQKLTTKDVKGIVINIDPFHITNYIKTYGGGWNYGKSINSPENVKALQTIFDMYSAGVAVTPKSLGYGWDGEVFANGKAAMSTGGYWYKSFLKDAAPNLKYAAIPVPKGTTEGSTMISDGYVVLKDAKDKLAAAQAAYYMTNDATQTEFMQNGLNSAVATLSPKYFEMNPEFKALEPALKTATDFAYPSETKKFKDELVTQLENTLLGGAKQTPQQILDTIQAEFK